MHLYRSIFRATLVAGLALAVAAPALAAPGSGDRYRVTTRFEVKDMPFQMPAQTTEVCTAKGGGDETRVPHDKNCEVLDYRSEAGKSRFRLRCTGRNALEGEGQLEQLGEDGYRGRMHAVTGSGGEKMDMTVVYEGKRIGDCDYSKESPSAVGNARLKEICEAQLDAPTSYKMYTGPKATCPDQRAAFCQRIGALAQRAADPAQYPSDVDGMIQWPAIEACGHSRSTITEQACTEADSSNNLAFIGAHCPSRVAAACTRADPLRDAGFVVGSCGERARTLAAQQCEGRGYTAMLSSPYRAFCSRYATERVRQRNLDAAGKATQGRGGR